MDNRETPLQILLVDDNEDDYFVVRDLFRDVGMEEFALSWASTYEEGLSMAQAGRHDLILVDYRLGANSGLDFLHEAADAGLKVPIVLMTGQGDHDIDVRAMQAGAADYLVKEYLNGPLLERVIRYAIDRSRSAQAQRESEGRFRALIEHSAEGILLGDSHGAITYASASTRRILGYEPEEIIGRAIRDMVHPDDLESQSKMSADLLQYPGIAVTSTYRLRHKDESWRWVESVATNWLHDPSVGAIVHNYRDVTERAQTEHELRQSEIRYRTLFETNPQPSWVYDQETLTFLAVNRAAIEHYGYTREEFLAMTLRDIRPTEDVPGLLRYLKHNPTVPQKAGVWRHRKKDGTVISVEITSDELTFDGCPARLAVVNDITERLRAEEALRASEERFDIVARATNDAIWDWDLRTDAIWWNQGFQLLFGYSPQTGQTSTSSWKERLHPDDVDRVCQGIHAVINSGKQVWSDEYRFRRSDGTYAFILDRGYMIRDEQGQPIRMIGSMLDITSRKRAESAVSQSEERYRSLVRASSQIVWISNADGTEMISQDWAAFTGQSGQEAQQLGWLSAVHPEDRNAVAAAWKKAVKTKSLYSVEYRLLKQDGSYAHVTTRGIPILEKDGRIREWVGMTANISERKMAEEERDRFFTLSLDLLCIADGKGYFKRLNPAFETVLGYSREELMAQPLTNFVHPEDLTATVAELEKVERGERSVGFVNRYLCRDGSYKWLSWISASYEGLSYAAARDITELKMAEEEQERLAALLENTTDFVGWAEPNGRAQYVNPAGRAMLGISADEDVSKMSIASMLPSWANQIIREKGWPTAMEKGVWGGQTALINRDGQEIPLSQVLIAHKNERGEVQFISTIARDVSRQKKVEAALQKANDELEIRVMERTAELEQANQELMIAKEEADAANQAKSDFLSRMSHELRTPLNAILGFGQILEMRNLGPKETEGVAQILKAGRHLLALINEVLDIARIEANRLSLSPEPIEVAQSLRECLDLVRPLAAARQVQLVNLLELEADQLDDWNIRADRQRFSQVMLNLLSNAIKYNREGGSVTLAARLMSPERGGTTNQLRIEVRDTGHGISREDQHRLFVPFERLSADRSQVEGTGIGLALAKRLVEAMEGKIGVMSATGEGSVFWVEMPLVEGSIKRLERLEPRLATASVIGQMAATIGPATLLYIEDNLSNLKIIERILADLPQINLLTAMQGGIGLEFARQHQPDLILLDLHLPDILGEDVLSRLKASSLTSDIPVVIVSADGTEKQISKLLAAGAKDYLTKPLDIGPFLRVLTESLPRGRQ